MGRLFNERRDAPPKFDLLSMLAHGAATRDMPLKEFMGNLALLVVGGNDTTRNSMCGGLLALNQFPAEYDKLQANPGLVDSAVSEIIRWQTPVIHMRRTASRDTELGGKPIKAGDKVVMWYISGNRDPDAIDNPEQLHRRPGASAAASVIRLRHPPLCRQPPRRTATEDPVAGNPDPLPEDRGRWRRATRLLQLYPRHKIDVGAHSCVMSRRQSAHA